MQITATRVSGDGQTCILDRAPDTCPRCHRHVVPKYVAAAVSADSTGVQAVFRCTNHACDQQFFGSYVSTATAKTFRLKSVGPNAPVPTLFPETIRRISPTFVQIYGQVDAAAAADLDQLEGIGLRKALEFLIKDYAVSQHPDEPDKIRSMMLGPCITAFVSDANVKECATRAAWLGNDETHYVRKWESKDVRDLRLLVRLTVNWIENELLTKKYIEEMAR